MPIYEYHCNKCSHNFEAMQKIGDNLIKSCPKCNGDEVKKLMSAPPFHLKGTGWYATDFKDKAKNTDKKDENGKAEVNADKMAEKGSEKKSSKEKDSKEKSSSENGSKKAQSTEKV